MTSAANEQLLTLVSNYYHGLVTFQSYRQQRGSILDGLRDQAPARAETASPASAQVPAQEPRTRAPQPAPQQRPALPAAHARARPRWVAWGSVAAAVAIVVAGWMAFQPSSEMPSVVSGSESPALLPGAALLEQFMQKNAWDADAVGNLEVTWASAFTEEQRQAALTSPTYARFSETLRARLREEEALSGPGGSPELDTLAALAGRFGVPYSRSARRAVPGTSSASTAPSSLTESLPPADAAAAARAGPDEPGAEGGEPLAEDGPPPSDAAPAPPIEPAANSETRTDSAATSTQAASSSAAAAPAVTGGTPPAACSSALLNTRRPYCSDPLRSGGTGPNLAIVPPGAFEMGGEQTNDEEPPHAVTIGRAFAMSVYEISFAEFGAYCRATGERCPENPWSSDDFPAALVSWDEAVAYARWLSSETGQSYRLPSEAEWEYAARAGSSTRYPFGDDVTPVAARSSANGPVDSPLANSDRSVNRNAFRLFHMIGNVREWVADHWYSGYAGAPTDGTARLGAEANPRVVRGGAYSDGPLQLRSAARAPLERDTRDRFTGFRVVRDLPL
jgi:formylglycine-generating enzyme required for sulfatase activity